MVYYIKISLENVVQNHLLIEGWTANILNFAEGLSARYLPSLFENWENCLMIFWQGRNAVVY